MSEKRFEFYSDEDLIGVLDTVTGKTFNSFEIVDCLNEQQDQISKLQANVEYLIDSKKELIEKIGEQQATITELKKDLKTVIDSYDCERIGYCHKGEYCKKWSLNNDR